MKIVKKILPMAIALTTMFSAIPSQVLEKTYAENIGAVTSDTKVTGFNDSQSSLDMELYARYNSGVQNADGGSLEIVQYNEQNGFAYAVSGVKGVIAAVNLDVSNGDKVADVGAVEYDVKALLANASGMSNFVYGDTTSLAISPDGKKLAASIQHAEYSEKGAVAVFDIGSDGSLSNPVLYSAGVQPDMVTFVNDDTVLSADEGEPRDGYGEGTVDPVGSVSVINLSSKTSTQVGFENFTSQQLIDKNVIVGVVDGEKLDPVADMEPEYIAVSQDGSKAYVSLQEANAIGVLDLNSNTFTDIFSAGYEDYSKVAVDLLEDDKYLASTYENLVGARMPDGISIYEVDGKTYLLTANEGDAREWGDYKNEAKTKSVTGKNIRVLDDEKCAGLPADQTVMFGGRSFTVLEVTSNGLSEVYDSKNEFEAKTAEYIPTYFNCSNDNTDIDDRSGKKGPEPENITVGTVNGKTYAFIAIERIGGVMAYDITDPSNSTFVNYINSREFDSAIQGDVSPEGLCFASSNTSGKPILIAACEVSGTMAVYELQTQVDGEIAILYTNDVHNAYEKSDDSLGYASVAAYKKDLEAQGYNVILVDAGDAIQGGIIGALSKGKYISQIMDQTGYSLAVPGNHEFDFGMDTFLDIANTSNYEYICSNFIDLRTNETVFEPYKIVNYDGVEVAFVGISTPETYTKSTPTYFQDSSGNYIYNFCEGDDGKELYDQVQKSIDNAYADGADYVIAIGHNGIDTSSSHWTSTEIIANTSGLSGFIDGHSHSTIESEICKDKNNNSVILSSTGSKLNTLGQMTIDNSGELSSKLITKIDDQDPETLAFVNSITAKFEDKKNEVVGKTDIDLVVNNPTDDQRMIRNQETNLGDFCADAYRTVAQADIAFVNGGGIRANISKGDVTFGDIINVNPYGNQLCVVEATGQEILDALELGSSATGVGESGGFLQVAGLTYQIDTRIPTLVVKDDKGLFVKVDGEYRVKNVMVGDKALDLTKTYTLASHDYMLKYAGDGYTMFMDNKFVKEEIMADNEVLIDYFVNTLSGNVKADGDYSNIYGQGRIKVIVDSKDPTCTQEGYIVKVQGSETVTETVSATGHTFGDWIVTLQPTETTEGSKYRVCQDCGYKEVVAIAKLSSSSNSSQNSNSSNKSSDSSSKPSSSSSPSKSTDSNPKTGKVAVVTSISAVILASILVVLKHKKHEED